MPRRKSQNTYCATCLSQDRRTFKLPIKRIKLITMLYDELTLTAKDKICWECKHFIKRIAIFRNRAIKAQKALCVKLNEEPTPLHSLSNLKISIGKHLEINNPPEKPQNLDIYLDIVKLETDSDCPDVPNNEPNMQCPEASMNEGMFEVFQHKITMDSARQNIVSVVSQHETVPESREDDGEVQDENEAENGTQKPLLTSENPSPTTQISSDSTKLPIKELTPTEQNLIPEIDVENGPAINQENNEILTTSEARNVCGKKRKKKCEMDDVTPSKQTRQDEAHASLKFKKASADTTSTNNKDNTDLDDGTKEAEELFEDWFQEAEAEGGESDIDDHIDGQGNPGRTDINLEAAILPPDMEGQVKQWLKNADAEADRTLRHMLPNDLDFDWRCDPTTFTAQRELFTASPGPTFDIDIDTTPLTVFRKFFNDDLLDSIVTQTNKYATRLIDNVTTESSRLLKWKNTDRDELLTFLAMVMLQGLAPLDVQYDYWRENGYLTLKYFKDLMDYNRFLLIKKALHFTDELTDTGLSLDQRRVLKMRPLLNHLNEKFSSLYIPKQNMVIDESLLKWDGRDSFAQKIAKNAKSGIKTYELCESDTGYLWSFYICTGKGNEATYDSQAGNKQTDSASSSQIVQILAKPLLGNGYTLVIDNLNNSPLLARYLKGHKTDCFGTLRISKEFVPEALKSLAETGMRVGETVEMFTRDMSIKMWRDTNLVSMISTFHGGEVGGKEKGRHKYRPQIVVDYNLAMGGVGKKDQMLSAHPLERTRNQGWYKKVFRRLLNVTIHNAYVIFKTYNPTITSRAFRQRLADDIIAVSRPRRMNTLVTPKLIFQHPGKRNRPILEGNHFIGEGASKHPRCVWCRQSRSKYICKQCGVSLCLLVCFEEYHTKP